MTLANDDGPSNGGAEAVRVAQRFWPADAKRSMELDAAIRSTGNAAKTKAQINGSRGGLALRRPTRPRSWVCPQCGNRNQDRSWCSDCRTPGDT